MVFVSGRISNKALGSNYDGYLWKEDELEDIKKTVTTASGLIEHNPHAKAGSVASTVTGTDKFVRVCMDIDDSTMYGKEGIEGVRSGKYTGFSCGQLSEEYMKEPFKWGVRNKQIQEVSLVKVPNVKHAMIEMFENPDGTLSRIIYDKDGYTRLGVERLPINARQIREKKKLQNTFISGFENGGYKLSKNGLTNRLSKSTLFEKRAMSTQASVGQTTQQATVDPAAVFNTGEPSKTTAEQQKAQMSTADVIKALELKGYSPEQLLELAEAQTKQEQEKLEKIRSDFLMAYAKKAQQKGVDPNTDEFYNQIKNSDLSVINQLQPIMQFSAASVLEDAARLSDMEAKFQEKNKEAEEYKKIIQENERLKRMSAGIGMSFKRDFTTFSTPLAQPKVITQQPPAATQNNVNNQPIPPQQPQQQVIQPQTPVQPILPSLVPTMASASTSFSTSSSQQTTTQVVSTTASAEPVPQPQQDPYDVPEYEYRKFGAPFKASSYLSQKYPQFDAMSRGVTTISDSSFLAFKKQRV
jgi:hypothetical protein